MDIEGKDIPFVDRVEVYGRLCDKSPRSPLHAFVHTQYLTA